MTEQEELAAYRAMRREVETLYADAARSGAAQGRPRNVPHGTSAAAPPHGAKPQKSGRKTRKAGRRHSKRPPSVL